MNSKQKIEETLDRQPAYQPLSVVQMTVLLNRAAQARKNAYVPYSDFAVGAALLCEGGRIYTGCNIENSAYPSGICAERTAIFKAISEGERHFVALAIVGAPMAGAETHAPCAPCGACLQVMAEFFSPSLPLVTENAAGQPLCLPFSDYLPFPFSL